MQNTALPAVYDISILSTDFAPDVPQAQLLKAKVAEDQGILVAMNHELTTLQLRVCELHDKITKVERTLGLNEALLSPSRRLAPEILGEVFTHCLPMDVAVTMTPSLPPLLLAHVCRRWRRVAYGTPHLWEKLYLGRGFSHEPRTLIPLWLHNSGVLPLDIRLGVQDWRVTGNSNYRILEADLALLLTPGVARWRSLAGSMSTFAIERLFSRDLCMPFLESLELWLPVWSSLVLPEMGKLYTPRLRSIILNDTAFVTKAFSGPLLSVRHLELTGQDTFGLLSHSSCLDFIALCPNIESCALTLSKDPGTTLHSPVVLDALLHLHLIFQFSPHDPIPFLRALRTPQIERLTLQNHGGVSPVPHIRAVLILLLSVLPHTITELNLSSLFVPTNDWVPSLRELTELTSLSIVGDSLDESFFEALTSIPWTCPRLTTLKLHHVTGLLGLSGDRLVAFIRSRSPKFHDGTRGVEGPIHHLKYVSLTLCSLERRHKDELREIEQACNGALRIRGLF